MLGNSYRTVGVKRWDGIGRITTDWDGLRRDPELWFPNGDCLVHLYGRGQSRRGPSLRVPFAAIQSSNCRPLIERFCVQVGPESPSTSSSSDGGYFGHPTSDGKYELYIPAPQNCSREESFRYHVTTRNFFAWMFGKPVVGVSLGKALVALLERMELFRSCEDDGDNIRDMMTYLEEEAYADFRDCPDHALALLYFAEHFEFHSLWTDAFVHCAGMNVRLTHSSEFEPISRVSKALITRAHLEMDLRLEHAGRLLSSFLEDELSGAYLGLSNGARVHLDRFRSFLNSFYVNKHGYWPPTRNNIRSSAFPKSTYTSMYIEFRNLYEYLVDEESSSSLADNKPANGGLCVLQNITAFDKRNKYASLPHPLPLVPETIDCTEKKRVRSFEKYFTNKQSKADRRVATLAALCAATNSHNVMVMECPLVRSYMRFEKECTAKEEEKVSSADARKVRWILVYAILQTLISVTRAPKEVRDTEGLTYPLCCQIAGTPPWKIGAKANEKKMEVERVNVQPDVNVMEIKPDSEVSTPTHKPITQPTNPLGSYPELTPLTINKPGAAIQQAQFSATSLNNRIYAGSKSGALWDREKGENAKSAIIPDADHDYFGPLQQPVLIAPQPRRTGFCEILVSGYGNANVTTHNPIEPNSALSSEDSDPSTPMSMASAGSRSWGHDRTSSSDEESSNLPDMDHASVTGSMSIYGDESVGERSRSGSCGFGTGVVFDPLKREYSVGSYRVRNEEVERYLGGWT
ncbi:MAG: hypothetical protein M1827_000900 [Pycnora praestabilis]|nr:MAG: hypothetical protein M1827_000900 [Pycnora praestabilis]